MSFPPTGSDLAVWRRLAESQKARDQLAFEHACMEFRSDGVDRVALLKSAFGTGDGKLATYMTRFLTPSELKEIFPKLVFLASWNHGSVGWIRDRILSIPRDWVLERIEQEAEPELAKGTWDEYSSFLALYSRLDRDLTLKLARRAAAHPDPEVRIVGEEYLEALGVD